MHLAPRRKLATAALWILAVSMVWIGVMHFVAPQTFVDIMPPWLPWHLELVLVSGAFEILGGVGVLHPRTRRAAGWGLVALYVSVFPANLHMALNDVPFLGQPVPAVALWLRLPVQAVFILWAWWATRPRPPGDGEPSPLPWWAAG